MSNVELFELCETIPKVQCSECLLYWNQGVIYCSCGPLLKESEASQNFNKLRKDALSIPHYVIKKRRPHGARHGKTEAQKEYYVAHNARKRCLKRNYEGIHDRFLRDPVYRDSQLIIGWTEEKCIEMDKLAQENHSYCPSSEEFREIEEKLVYFTEQIRQKCTDEPPIRLPNSSHNHEPPPPWIWRRATWTNSSLSIPKVAIRRLLHPVPHGGSGMNTGGAHKLKNVCYFWAHETSSLKEQEDLFWTLTHQETQSGILTIFEFVAVRSFSSWYQFAATDDKGEQNTLTRHIFSCFTAHISVSHVTLAQVSCAHVIHVSFAWCCCLDILRLSTLHSSPSLSSSFSFSWSSSSSSMWVGSVWSTPCTSANEELVHFGREQSSHKLKSTGWHLFERSKLDSRATGTCVGMFWRWKRIRSHSRSIDQALSWHDGQQGKTISSRSKAGSCDRPENEWSCPNTQEEESCEEESDSTAAFEQSTCEGFANIRKTHA